MPINKHHQIDIWIEYDSVNMIFLLQNFNRFYEAILKWRLYEESFLFFVFCFLFVLFDRLAISVFNKNRFCELWIEGLYLPTAVNGTYLSLSRTKTKQNNNNNKKWKMVKFVNCRNCRNCVNCENCAS